MAELDPDENVLLIGRHAHAVDRGGGELVLRRRGAYCHPFDGVGVFSQGVTNPVAELLDVVIGIDRD